MCAVSLSLSMNNATQCALKKRIASRSCVELQLNRVLHYWLYVQSSRDRGIEESCISSSGIRLMTLVYMYFTIWDSGDGGGGGGGGAAAADAATANA